jgi:hypothetical protein
MLFLSLETVTTLSASCRCISGLAVKAVHP